MTNKTTRKAFLLSSLSLLLCFAMLLGTTFAWFTDSVTSASNVIKAGNLDVKVEYTLDGTNWKDLDGANDLFQKNLWEPGHTEVVALRITNDGSLALKYTATMNIVNEAVGKTKDGADIVLSDILTVSTLAQQVNSIGDIAVGLAFTGEDKVAYETTAAFKDANVLKADNELQPGAAHYLIVKVDMAETVGNEANHDGINVPSIDFGINVLATQFTYENDSFGNQYDKDADYVVYDHKVSDLAGLKDAFAAGGNVLLEEDVTFEKITAIEPGKEVYLNMNGKTITVDQNTASNTLIWIKDGGKLIIDGNGTFDLQGVSTMAIFAPYGELVIENGTFIRDAVTTVTDNTAGLFMGCKVTASNVTINGGYFDSGYYNEDAADIEAILAGTKTFEETADDIAKRGNSKDANKVRVAIKENLSCVLNHSGYGTFKVYGGTFVGANPAWGDEGCMLPTTPNYLRPWSYYQGALLAGQTFNENGLVLPAGYTITNGTTADGRPTYTVNYSK